MINTSEPPVIPDPTVVDNHDLFKACANKVLVSGQPANDPVISPQGHIFERSLIETYIKENGTEPVTGDSINVEDLISVKSTPVVTPRPTNLTSIPSLLSAFQSEWDSLALEVFSLKKQLLDTKQQLSSALYHNDAAVRVVARLTKERDEARDSLAKLAASLGSNHSTNGNQHDMDVDDYENENNTTNDDSSSKDTKPLSSTAVLPFASSIAAKKKELSSARKAGSFKINAEVYLSAHEVSNFHEIAKTKQLLTNVSKLASVVADESLVVSGGGKNTAAVFDSKSQSLIQTVSTKAIVTSVAPLASGGFVVGLKNGQVQVFPKSDDDDGHYEQAYITLAHSKSSPSVDVAVLPYGDIVVSGGKDGSWSIIDHANDQVYTYSTGASGVGSVAVHPDGGLVAIGTSDGKILVYDVTDQLSEPAAVFEGSEEPVTSLSFAQNGKWLASASSASVSVWNLRTVDLMQIITFDKLSGAEIHTILFDKSSDYLLAASSSGVDVAMYTKSEKSFTAIGLDISDSAIDATWGPNGKTIVSVSTKGTFHIYGV